MHTRIAKCSQDSNIDEICREAAELLHDGQVVVFPTETVYGVGASAASREAIEALRQVKGRPQRKPFTVHVATGSDAEAYVDHASRLARRFLRKTWPGPLTLILDAPQVFDPQLWKSRAPAIEPPIPELVYHDGTVGLRCPAHDIATRILRMAGVPVVASSANLMGNAPPYDAVAAARDLDGRVPLIVDAGTTRYAAPSTIVRVRDDQWSVIREGVLSQRYLEKLLSMTLLFVCTGNSCRSPMAAALARMEVARRLGCRDDQLEGEHGIKILSAGVFAPPGREASEEARNEIRRRGGSLDGHRTTPVSVERIREADAIFCMTASHRDAVLALTPEAADKTFMLDPDGRDTQDPLGGGPEVYKASADQIEAAVRKRVEERFA
ncbi:MAG: threonylcarbamoyl-AMP synthase [Planctomycetes bacterium]|nr:threonylcarbamoyl-AMP synthase [Planctomycetota bacterium]